MAEILTASPVTILFALLFFGIMAVAAIYDLVSYTIPNFLPLILICGFAGFVVLHPLSWQIAAAHLGTGLAMLALGWALFAAGLLGGGDAKLFAATSLWMGWEGMINYLILFSIFGGVVALLLILFRAARLSLRLANNPWIGRLHTKTQGVPYGIALALGAVFAPPAVLLAGAM